MPGWAFGKSPFTKGFWGEVRHVYGVVCERVIVYDVWNDRECQRACKKGLVLKPMDYSSAAYYLSEFYVRSMITF